MTIVTVVVVIIIIAVSGVAIYYVGLTKTSSNTISNTSTSSAASNTASSSSSSSSGAVTSSSSSSGTISTLTIDEALWPGLGVSPFAAIFDVTGSNWWLESVYQTLVTVNGNALYHNGTVEPVPDLATNWTEASNGLTFTFNLRQNVNFSNGDPFNAYQVWSEWYEEYYVEGNVSNFMTGYNLFNFTGVNFGPSTVALMVQSGVINPSAQLKSIMENSSWPIYVTGPYQIVLHIKAPFNFVPEVLVQFSGVIIDAQFILEHGGFGNLSSGFNPAFDSIPVPGTGPYILSSFVTNSYEKFTQNPTYWGRNLTASEIQANPYIDPGHVQTVFVFAKTDDLVRFTDLSTGTAQIATIFKPDWPLVLSKPDQFSYTIFPNKATIVEGVAMNVLRYPTNITAFRQAMVHAINYSNLGANVFFGQLAPLVGPTYPPFSQFYNLGNLPPYSYNLSLAQQDLLQSGVNVKSLQPLQFVVITGCTVCQDGAQVIQSDLGAIGIPVNIEVVPSSELTFPYVAGYGPYSASLPFAQQEAQITWLGYPTYAPNEPTPADSWISWVNNQSLSGNDANYAKPNVQACVDSLLSTTNVTQQQQLCTTAQLQVYNDAPYMWLGVPELPFGSGSVVYNNHIVKGFLMDPTFTGESTTAIINTVTLVGS